MSTVTDKTPDNDTDSEDGIETDSTASSGGRPPVGKLPAPASSGGFFAMYKKGQGKWTRGGTWIAVALILALTAHFLYENVQVWLVSMLYTPAITDAGASVAEIDRVNALNVEGQTHAVSLARLIAVISAAVVVLGGAALTHLLINKPKNADFLIATDSEMRKVNWTSRAELIGSTKVVIGFMFFIAFLLFAMDITFAYLFHLMKVLQ